MIGNFFRWLFGKGNNNIKLFRKAIKQNKKVYNKLKCKYCANAKIMREEQAEALDDVLENTDDLAADIMERSKHRAFYELNSAVKEEREKAKEKKAADGKPSPVIPTPTDEEVEELAYQYYTEELQEAGNKLNEAVNVMKRQYHLECDMHCVKLFMQTKEMQFELDEGKVK